MGTAFSEEEDNIVSAAGPLGGMQFATSIKHHRRRSVLELMTLPPVRPCNITPTPWEDRCSTNPTAKKHKVQETIYNEQA